MAQKKSVVFESEFLKVVHHKSNGKRNPERVSVTLPARPGEERDRHVAMSIDELFDLTEVLDDLCDVLEDREEHRRALNDRF